MYLALTLKPVTVFCCLSILPQQFSDSIRCPQWVRINALPLARETETANGQNNALQVKH
jgi:hypothetical protein